jgi:nicotinamide riboside kinase
MKIVITGGPSSGKTSVVEILARSASPCLKVVEEAAALLFRGGFLRHTDPEKLKCQQIAIYHVQRQLENIAMIESPARPMICDRGSLDGLAYWPDDQTSFFRAIESSMEKELLRYDWVIHLDTVKPTDSQRDGFRTEEAKSASAMNDRVKRAWSLHPNRIVIDAHQDFLNKIHRAVNALSLIVARNHGRNSEPPSAHPI